MRPAGLYGTFVKEIAAADLPTGSTDATLVREDDVSGLPAAAQRHRLFAGRLDHRQLSFSERALVLAVRAAEGDYRDWD